MKILAAVLAVVGTYLMAPHLFPPSFAQRCVHALEEAHATCRRLFDGFGSAVAGFHRREGFKGFVEMLAVSAAFLGLVAVGALWIRVAEPLLIPTRFVTASRVALGLGAYAGFYASIHFLNTVAIDRKPVTFARLAAYAPLLLIGALPAALGIVAMATTAFLTLALSGLVILTVLLVLKGQVIAMRWAAKQQPDRLLGFIGLGFVVAAAILAL